MGVSAAVSMVALGTGMSAYGKMRAGQEAKHIAEGNAKIQEYQAEDALERGFIEERRVRRQTKQVIGSQRASLASQGIDINAGSALDVVADAAYLGELDALEVKNNAAKEAWGFRVGAADARARGKIAEREGTFGAFQTIVGSSSSLLLAKYGGYGYGYGRRETPY